MSIFTRLPADILQEILSHLDYKTLLYIHTLCIDINNFCYNNLNNVLCMILKRITKFDVRHRDRKQLLNLYKISPIHATIAAGSYHSLFIKSDGGIYMCGYNDDYKPDGVISSPTLLPCPYNIIHVSAGESYSLLLDNNGQVYSYGHGSDKTLRLSDDVFNITPIPKITNVVNIAAGRYHFLTLNDNFQVHACGENAYGQLGLGEYVYTLEYTIVENLTDIIQISAGSFHSLALRDDGVNRYVYAFGDNRCGQLGLNDIIDTKNIPQIIQFEFVPIQISAGSEHSLVLDITGEVYAFGSNYYGQLGLNDRINRFEPVMIKNICGTITRLSTGAHHSLILNDKHEIYAFGDNAFGQLGLNDNNNRIVPTLIPDMCNITEMSCGALFSLVSDDAKIYGFGNNNNKELGLDVSCVTINCDGICRPVYVMSL